jgi:sterol desaturase/sphingolipid hydroxylase (fatty acid hydroxylase superfamily)
VIETLLAAKGIAVSAGLGLLLVGERWLPAVPRRGGWPRIGRNAALWLINVGISALFIVPLTAGASTLGLGWRPGWLDGWAGFALDLVLLDFLIYWWHRANHAIPLLWRFHEVHHRDEFLDVSSAVRFHAGEVVLSALARAAAIIVLDIGLASVLAFEAIVLLAAGFHHSNLRLPPALEAALARAVITPSLHWVHHHAVRADTDSTYGTVASFWDRLFGTASATRRTPDMPIGVEGRSDLPLPVLMVRPFERSAAD